MNWIDAPEIKVQLSAIVDKLPFEYIKTERIFTLRSTGAKTRAYARIWSFPKIFQNVLEIEPAYVIEFVSQHFDKLNDEKKIKVIIHELLHIPKNFSGSLLPHSYGNKKISQEVERLYKLL